MWMKWEERRWVVHRSGGWTGEIEGWKEEERERSTIREKVWGGELNTAALSQPAVLLFCLVGL